LGAAHTGPFVTAITAELVVTYPVIHALQWDVEGAMTLILAVEARERQGQFEIVVPQSIGSCQRGMVGKMRAGRCARFITAIGTVAVIIVHGCEGDLDGRVGDAGECVRILEKFGNCNKQ